MSTSFAKHIHTFYSIDISQNSLVLCDIDDTVLFVPKYSESFYKEGYNYYTSIGYNEQISKQLIRNDWDLYSFFKKPSITDKEGFFYLLDQIEKTNSKLYFVTARSEQHYQRTINELKHVDIDCSKTPIYYTNGNIKGDYIKLNINLLDYDNVIFIDDNDLHLENVKKEIPYINCYKFIHIDKNAHTNS